MEKSKKNVLLILLAGIVISLSMAAMMISGHINLNCFFDVGEIYDIPRNGQVATENVTYIAKKNFCMAETEHAARRFMVEDEGICWNFLYLEADLDGRKSLPVKIELKDREQKTIAILEREIYEGKNNIFLEGQEFYLGYIWLENQKGQKFLFDNMRLFEREPVFFLWDGMKYAAIIFAVYLAAVALWRKVGNWNLPVDFGLIKILQHGYCTIGNFFWKLRPFSGKVRGRVRTGLFLGLLLYTVVIYRLDIYYTHYWCHMVLGAIFIFLLGIFSIEKKLEVIDWGKPLVRYWMLFWLLTIVSDILVKKRVMGYVGIVMIFVMGFTCFVWNQMECQNEIINNLLDAMEIAFWINVPICLLFFPFIEGTRYIGPMRNAAIYGMYMVVTVIMFVLKIEREFRKGRLSVRLFCYVAGLATAFYMLWKTQSVTDIIVIGILACLYGARVFLLRRKLPKKRWEKKEKRKIASVIGIVGGCFLFVYILAFWGFSNISALTDILDANLIEIEYSPPQMEEYMDGSSRLVDKLYQLHDIEAVTSGRNLYWREYLRGMNLWGHKYKAHFFGHSRWAHNQILWIAYYYGVISVIPYLFLLVEGLKEAFNGGCPELGSYRMIPMGMIFSILIISMADNVEQPFGLFVWYLLYMMLGFLFVDKRQE